MAKAEPKTSASQRRILDARPPWRINYRELQRDGSVVGERKHAFFKTARDQMKAHALVSHLERAKARISPDLYETALSLKWAQKAMEKIKKARAEYFFSANGWLHVVEICEDLARAAREAHREDLICISRSIYEWALQNEDRIGKGGVLSVFESTLSKDPSKALPLLESAAAQGDAEAQFLLGSMYVSGEGTPKNLRKAVELFERAGAQGNVDAKFNLGVIHANGMGIPKDMRKAIELFEVAAAQGHAGARFNLGAMYVAGEGIPKNERKGLDLLELAAGQRYAPAFDMLGLIYSDGLGVREDEVQAYARFSVAVALGHDGAIKNVAKMDRDLSQTKKDEAQALAKRILESLTS